MSANPGGGDYVPEPKPMSSPWRVGRHYPIHVYEGDEPVATFLRAADAQHAVDLEARAIRAETRARRGEAMRVAYGRDLTRVTADRNSLRAELAEARERLDGDAWERLTAERDRARDVAVALEQENAQLTAERDHLFHGAALYSEELAGVTDELTEARETVRAAVVATVRGFPPGPAAYRLVPAQEWDALCRVADGQAT